MLRSILTSIAAAVLGSLISPAAAAGELPDFPFTLTRPTGAGPFPAVVILHDCSGLGPRSSGAPWRWASELMQRGYLSIWPDSFTPRGRPNGVCAVATAPRITIAERAADVRAALRYLQSLPIVDGRRIAIMGGSHGGSGTLAAIVDTPANAAPDGAGFAAAIALYPGCGSYGDWSVVRSGEPGRPIVRYSGAFKPTAPLLILIGEDDDWTPAEPCRQLAAAAQAAGHPVTIKVYPGAHHSFDSLAPTRYVAERINFNAPGGRGATTGGNATAWADAIFQVERFLGEHLAK